MRTYTYSFLDTVASIVGPGGAFNLAAGAAAADEGITVEPVEDLDEMTIGADGNGMHSLRANKGAKITVRLLKASPVNSQLQTMLAFQRTSGANHGQNQITIVGKVSNDVISAQMVAFARQPTITYSKDGAMIEWTFNAIVADFGLGAGS